MLGEVLRNARLAANLSQEKLAFKAEIDRTYVSRLENDLKSPTVDMLFRIATALGVPASEILARVEKRQGKTKSR